MGSGAPRQRPRRDRPRSGCSGPSVRRRRPGGCHRAWTVHGGGSVVVGRQRRYHRAGSPARCCPADPVVWRLGRDGGPAGHGRRWEGGDAARHLVGRANGPVPPLCRPGARLGRSRPGCPVGRMGRSAPAGDDLVLVGRASAWAGIGTACVGPGTVPRRCPRLDSPLRSASPTGPGPADGRRTGPGCPSIRMGSDAEGEGGPPRSPATTPGGGVGARVAAHRNRYRVGGDLGVARWTYHHHHHLPSSGCTGSGPEAG